MDINRNQQTNTFVKGMDTDTSDMLLESDKYRYAENVRIITNTDSNTGELRLIEGNTGIDLGKTGRILSFDSMRDIIVFVTKDGNETWSVYTYNPQDTVSDENPHKVLTIEDQAIWKSNDDLKPITTVLRWESDNNKKLYIADNTGTHGILVVDLSKTYTSTNFSEVFEYQEVVLDSPKIQIYSQGQLKPAIVQYAYRMYKENGSVTTLSALSKPLSLYKNYNSGYAYGKTTNKSVKINITPGGEVLNRIQLYRITYEQVGQEPTIHLIRDEKFLNGEYIDYGTNIQTISTSEFISMYNLQIRPKVIESKSDYLFAANLSYQQDSIDDDFKNFDARAYNKGAVVVDGQIVGNQAFGENNQSGVYDSSLWEPVNGYNGIGTNIAWKYVYNTTHVITPTDYQNSCRTYRRGEVYRFGIRLFNKKGIPSSVKWIADIQMPDDNDIIVDDNSQFTNQLAQLQQYYAKEIGIKFVPLETPAWDDVSAYEIVQCPRTIADKFTLTQGIVGHVHEIYTFPTENLQDYSHTINSGTTTNYLTPVGFLSMEDIYAIQSDLDSGGLSSNGGYSTIGPNGYSCRYARPNRSILQFASPEYVYQPDDIRNIISQADNNVHIECVASYIPNSEICTDIYDRYSNILTDMYSTRDSVLVSWRDRASYQFYTPVYFVMSSYTSTSPYALGVHVENDNEYKAHIESRASAQTLISSYEGNGDKFYYFGPEVAIYNTGRDLYGTQTLYGITAINGVTGVSDEKLHRSTGRLNIETQNENSNLAWTQHFFNYLFPVKQVNTKPFITENISNISYADSPEYNQFSNSNTLTIKNNVTSIGNKTFVNWTAPFITTESDPSRIQGLMDHSSNLNSQLPQVNGPSSSDGYHPESQGSFYPIGTGGRCMLLQLENQLNRYQSSEDILQHMPEICVANIKQNTIPYGGYTETSINNSKYISVGAYKKILPNEDKSISVFEGDAFIKIFTYYNSHDWFDPLYRRFFKNATVYAVPLEMDIDIQGQFSNSLYGVTTQETWVQDKASAFNGYTQEDDAYLYNTAYNAETDVSTWYPDTRTSGQVNNYDTRVHYSQKKSNNETIDSWTQFKTSDFIDVDTRYGEITALELFKNKLIFWQNRATGILSVNERVIVQDINSIQIALGTGQVLERFDYLSTSYGQVKEQYNQDSSDSTLYWWDGNNKEILSYTDGTNIIQLSTVRNIKNYINERQQSTSPLIMYDQKYKEVVCNVVNNESVVYNEMAQAFTSVYKYAPYFYCNIIGQNYSAREYTNNNITIFKENYTTGNSATLFTNSITPIIKYVVNQDPQYNKVFDIQTFGGRFYGGGSSVDETQTNVTGDKYARDNEILNNIKFIYKTPLKQESRCSGKDTVSNLEYDFRITVPRAGKEMLVNGNSVWTVSDYGDRMKGKTMQCEIKSISNNLDFSLQYIITKFRISWA